MDIYQSEITFPLTFNQITKLCSDIVLIDPNGQPSNFQWHRFQLVEIAKLLEIPYTDNWTGHLRSRTDLGYAIQEKLTIRVNDTLHIPDKLKTYGLIPQKTTEYSISNIGGIPKQALDFHPTGTDVIFTEQNTYVYREPPSTLTDTTVKPDRLPHVTSVNKIAILQQTRQRDQNICVSGGPLWFNNKCYLDSVIMVLFQPSPTNLTRNLILERIPQSITEISNDNEINVLRELVTLDEKFQNYQILPLRKLTQLLGRINRLSLSEYYTTNRPQDAQDALLNILEILHLPYYPANIHQEWYTYESSEGMDNITITANGPNDNHLLDPDMLYNHVIQSKHLEYTQIDSSIILHTVPIESLLTEETPETVSLSNFLVYQIDTEIPDEFVKTNHGWDYHSETQIFQYTDSDSNQYNIVPDEIHEENKVYYYVGDDKPTSDYVITTGLEIGNSKYERHIIQYGVTNANFLVMSLSRGKAIGRPVIDHKIIPDQTIRLENRTVELQSMICYAGNINNGHYYSYYRCGDIWFKYNDIGCEIQEIGDYASLTRRLDVCELGYIFIYQPGQ
jgi:hypothetical protein